MPHIEAIREVMRKLTEAVRTPLLVEDTPFGITFSAGFAVFPDDAQDVDTLLAQADQAMFYAKAQGRNHAQLYADMTQKGLGKRDIYIQQRLVAAVREARIQMHFQPIVRARDGAVVAVEALARWHEPELGWVGPSTFIPMAENQGLMRELGEHVWRQALTDLTALKAAVPALSLAVNLSRRQLFAPYFSDNLCRDLAQQGLTPADIVLEITESTAMLDVEHAFERLDELARAGFRLAIDDFGTGYSSLAQLHEMHAHELKIDISFVRRLNTPEGAKLVEAIVGMARTLGLVTVAEGVEDERAARILAAMGVDLLQGYHFGRPMPAPDLHAWLQAATVHRVQ
jgi:predicted signal transduction protein with EAL and GGDEF domain